MRAARSGCGRSVEHPRRRARVTCSEVLGQFKVEVDEGVTMTLTMTEHELLLARQQPAQPEVGDLAGPRRASGGILEGLQGRGIVAGGGQGYSFTAAGRKRVRRR